MKDFIHCTQHRRPGKLWLCVVSSTQQQTRAASQRELVPPSPPTPQVLGHHLWTLIRAAMDCELRGKLTPRQEHSPETARLLMRVPHMLPTRSTKQAGWRQIELYEGKTLYTGLWSQGTGYKLSNCKKKKKKKSLIIPLSDSARISLTASSKVAPASAASISPPRHRRLAHWFRLESDSRVSYL